MFREKKKILVQRKRCHVVASIHSKHLNFCSWVSVTQYIITRYLQHAKHSCGTVNTREEKNFLFFEYLKVGGIGEMILHKSDLKAGWDL